ncbi:MAG: integrase arm-type DNA-binding domain-containing protein [Pseudomonadota bacterium]
MLKMRYPQMAITDLKCKNAKPKDKPYRIAAGGSMYLEITPNGSKYWRMKYRVNGKEKLLALGVYPKVSVTNACHERDRAKELIKAGTDPTLAKNDEKRKRILESEHTFEVVAREWHEKQLNRWTSGHAESVLRRLELDIFSQIGDMPITDVNAPTLLEALRKVERRGALDIAGRLKQMCGAIFRYGIATGKCERDHAADLRNALKIHKTKHFSALDIKEIPEFLKDLERNEARLYARTRRATQLLMLTFVRTTELIEATWDEFDLENAVWEIPAGRMKMRKGHIVPLSRQVLALLKEQQEETGHFQTKWVFPNQVRPAEPMSDGTIISAIKRLGYGGKMTGHGFRALARTTICEKLGYNGEVIERQLAHLPSGSLGAAYDRTQFIPERKEMMQAWADYLDAVASEGKVIVGDFRKKA